MKTFTEFMTERASFTNWVRPNDEDIALEYKVEYQIKPLKQMTGDAFPTVEDFKKAVKAAKVIELTDAVDRKIQYRSKTKSKEAIISLIKGYASYPKFRNEQTIDAIYKAFADNKPMKMPFVIQFKDGTMRIMSGNTRADIAQQMGIVPKALLIQIP